MSACARRRRDIHARAHVRRSSKQWQSLCTLACSCRHRRRSRASSGAQQPGRCRPNAPLCTGRTQPPRCTSRPAERQRCGTCGATERGVRLAAAAAWRRSAGEATPQHAPPVRGDVRAQPDVSHAAQLVAGNDATRLPPLGVDDDDAGYARHVHVLRRHGLVVREQDSGPAGVERRQLVNAQQPDLRRREHRQVHPRGAAAVLLRVRDAAARAAASVGSRSVASGGIRRRRTHRAFRTGAARWARLASTAASTRSSSTRWSACSVGMPCAALPRAARCWRAAGPRAWAGVANLGGSRKTSPCNGLGRRARHSTHT